MDVVDAVIVTDNTPAVEQPAPESDANKAQRIADLGREAAVEAGAGPVIVMVLTPEGQIHVSWKGSDLAVRGLAEYGMTIVRRNLGGS